MSTNKTPNMNMHSWVGTDNVKRTEFNDNFNAIDTAFGLVPVTGEVRVATTANITLSGTQTIDGVALAVGDRVLVKNQTTASQNGIYNVQTGAWTRAVDADTTAKIAAGIRVYVKQGTANANEEWRCTTTGAITLGTTGLTFALVSGADSASDTVIGNRTITDTTAQTSGATAALTTLLGQIGNMIKGITGKANWWTAPAISLQTLSGYVNQDVRTTASPTFAGLTIGNSPVFKGKGDLNYNVSPGYNSAYRVITDGADAIYPVPFGVGTAFSSYVGGGEYTMHLYSNNNDIYFQMTADGGPVTKAGWKKLFSASGGTITGETTFNANVLALGAISLGTNNAALFGRKTNGDLKPLIHMSVDDAVHVGDTTNASTAVIHGNGIQFISNNVVGAWFNNIGDFVAAKAIYLADQTGVANSWSQPLYLQYRDSVNVVSVGWVQADPGGNLWFANSRGTYFLHHDGMTNSRTYVFAYANVSQSIAASTLTKVNFPSLNNDTKGEFNTSTSRFIASKYGVYLVNVAIEWGTGTAGDMQYVYVRRYNSSAVYQESYVVYRHPSTTSGAFTATGYVEVLMSAGDFIQVEVTTTSGRSIVIDTARGTRLQVSKLS